MSRFELLALDQQTETRLKSLYKTLSEKDKRRFAAMEAAQLGYGGIKYIAGLLGCSVKTISRGIAELDRLDEIDTPGRIRRPGAGRPKKLCPAPMLKATSNRR